MDPEIADCNCYACGRPVRLGANLGHGTHHTRLEGFTGFRCFCCGRVFCGGCAGEHFGVTS